MAWAYSVFAENGRLPKLDAPTLWDFSRPPRLSVDDGRESKMEVEEVRVGTKNISEVLEARGLNEDDFIESRARSVWNRKYKAKIIAEELNKKYGQDIEIEEREMFMLTANEMGEQSEIETKSKEESQNEND
jgi:hypothetical protein